MITKYPLLTIITTVLLLSLCTLQGCRASSEVSGNTETTKTDYFSDVVQVDDIISRHGTDYDLVRINSFEDLISNADIVKVDYIEVDIEKLLLVEEYCNKLKYDYSALSLYPHEGINLIPARSIICYKMRYRSDDEEVVGYISAPADYQTAEYPLLVFNRGGNGDYSKLEGYEVQYIAQHGFIVLASQYRGADGGTGKDEFGGGDVNDVIKLIDTAAQFSFSNGKIYMMGWSRGAMQTYIVLSRDNRVNAAVAGAGFTDLFSAYDESDTDMKINVFVKRVGRPSQDVAEYRARSVLFWPEAINTPLLIAHGTDDERVQVHHSTDLYTIMSELSKIVELIIYPDMDHSEPFWAFVGDYLYWLKQH